MSYRVSTYFSFLISLTFEYYFPESFCEARTKRFTLNYMLTESVHFMVRQLGTNGRFMSIHVVIIL